MTGVDISEPRHIWEALDAATRARTGFTLGHLGTVGADGQPHVRAVILREVDAEAGTVYFSTNAFSAKVAQLERNPLAAVTFYDASIDVQLRLEGRAEIVTDERRREAAWASFGTGTRQLFDAPLRPGSPLSTDGVSGATVEAGASAYDRFAWVALRVNLVDAIDLSGEEHLRFISTRAGDNWTVERVVP